MKMTYYSPAWGYPTSVVVKAAGKFLDVRDNGWGGYGVSDEISAAEMRKTKCQRFSVAEIEERFGLDKVRSVVAKYMSHA